MVGFFGDPLLVIMQACELVLVLKNFERVRTSLGFPESLFSRTVQTQFIPVGVAKVSVPPPPRHVLWQLIELDAF